MERQVRLAAGAFFVAATLCMLASTAGAVAKGFFNARVKFVEFECKRVNEEQHLKQYECQTKNKVMEFTGEIYFPRYMRVTELGSTATVVVYTKDIAAIVVAEPAIRRRDVLAAEVIEIYLRNGKVLKIIHVSSEVFLLEPNGKQVVARLISSGTLGEGTARIITKIDFKHGKRKKRGK